MTDPALRLAIPGGEDYEKHKAWLKDVGHWDWESLVRLIQADWHSDLYRNLAADFLDDDVGDEETAEFIRLQLRLESEFGAPRDGGPVVTGDREADLREGALRFQCNCLFRTLFGSKRPSCDKHSIAVDAIPGYEARVAHRDSPWPWAEVKYARGFIDELLCGGGPWTAYGTDFLKRNPVGLVRLAGPLDIQVRSGASDLGMKLTFSLYRPDGRSVATLTRIVGADHPLRDTAREDLGSARRELCASLWPHVRFAFHDAEVADPQIGGLSLLRTQASDPTGVTWRRAGTWGTW